MGNTLQWCLKSANPRLARRHFGIFASWPHGANVANTVPNLFPTRARIEAGTGLIMGDGLTRAATDVGSSVQTLSPVIRGRCRDGLPSERNKTASRSGPRSCQPGVFRWTRFSASVQIQSPRLFFSHRCFVALFGVLPGSIPKLSFRCLEPYSSQLPLPVMTRRVQILLPV